MSHYASLAKAAAKVAAKLGLKSGTVSAKAAAKTAAEAAQEAARRAAAQYAETAARWGLSGKSSAALKGLSKTAGATVNNVINIGGEAVGTVGRAAAAAGTQVLTATKHLWLKVAAVLGGVGGLAYWFGAKNAGGSGYGVTEIVADTLGVSDTAANVILLIAGVAVLLLIVAVFCAKTGLDLRSVRRRPRKTETSELAEQDRWMLPAAPERRRGRRRP